MVAVVPPLALAAVLAAAAPAAPPAARGATTPCPAADARAAQAPATTLERAVRCLVNRERARRGLPALRADARLGDAAGAHSADMVRRRYFDHLSPGGATPSRRAARAGYRAASVGETIAWGTGASGSPAGTVERWMDSPPHRRILLEPRLRDIGVGVAAGAPVRGGHGGTTVTAVLGRR